MGTLAAYNLLTPEQQLAVDTYQEILNLKETVLATYAEIAQQIRDGVLKERADHQRILDQTVATLTNERLTAEQARDEAVAALEAERQDKAATEPEFLSIVDDLASNDLPDEQPEQPVDEPVDTPQEPGTEPAPEPTTPEEPAGFNPPTEDGAAEPVVVNDDNAGEDPAPQAADAPAADQPRW